MEETRQLTDKEKQEYEQFNADLKESIGKAKGYSALHLLEHEDGSVQIMGTNTYGTEKTASILGFLMMSMKAMHGEPDKSIINGEEQPKEAGDVEQ